MPSNERSGAYELPSWAIALTLYGRGARASCREETMRSQSYEISSHWPTMTGLVEAFALLAAIGAVALLIWAVAL